MYLTPNYRHDLFRGTADFYVKYRTPYLESMLNSLIKITAIKTKDRLLDLACGPGRLSIPLAKYFNEVVAIDLEEEMITAGKNHAKNMGVNNILWKIGKAEEINEKLESFKLTTIGDAYHRLDQLCVLNKVSEALTKGGFIAIIGGASIIANGNRSWQTILNKTLSKWYKPNISGNSNNWEQVPNSLIDFGFKDVMTNVFEETITLTVEEIIGFLYSMSIFSTNIIGNDKKEFEKTITDNLLELEPTNIFEWDFSCVCTLGRKNN